MKKHLFLFAAAALALASCSSDDTIAENSSVGSQQQKEISLFAVNQKATRAAILDGTFPTESAIQVAAFDAGNSVNFFNASTFSYNSDLHLWKCSTPKYWPLSPATINFLGYANLTGTAVWNTSTFNAHGVTLTMTDNSTTQNDLMYAVGQGKVTQTGNSLSVPEKVDMVFTHAQALLTFKVKANIESTITLKKITLNNAIYSGSLAIVNNNYNLTTPQAITSATWTPGDPTASLDVFDGTYAVTTSSEKKADIMVVPHPSAASFDSFTLTYAINGVDYTYTFIPLDRNLAKATNYVYDINFTLHEILINATVTEWTGTTTNYVEVPTKAFNYSTTPAVTAGTFTLPSLTDGTYSCTITGLPADTYKVVEKTDEGQDIIDAISPTSTVTLAVAGDPLNISFTVKNAAASNTRKIEIQKNSDSSVLFTLTIAAPAP